MKFKLAVGATFGFFLVASLIVHLPASWLWQYAPKVRGLTVIGISGTPWQGSASSVIWNKQGVGRLYWDLQLSNLLKGQLAFRVRFGQGSDLKLQGRGVVGYGFSGGFADKLLVSVPAESVMSYAKIPVPLQVAGNLELTIRQYQYAKPYCESLDATLAWPQGSIETPMGNINPGPVFTDLTCQQGAIAAKAAQSSGDISSNWQASLMKNQRYTLTGWFKPGASFPEQLTKQLKWLGDPDNKGQYKVNYSGRL